MKFLVAIVFTVFSLSSIGQKLIDYSDIYIVVADSGSNFNELDNKAYGLSKVLEVAYYTNKKFDTEKGLVYSDKFIAENKHDVIEYSHRRFATNDVSVERSKPYFEKTSNNMILIAGMFNKKAKAEKTLFETKAFFPNAFIHTKEMYLGCDY